MFVTVPNLLVVLLVILCRVLHRMCALGDLRGDLQCCVFCSVSLVSVVTVISLFFGELFKRNADNLTD